MLRQSSGEPDRVKGESICVWGFQEKQQQQQITTTTKQQEDSSKLGAHSIQQKLTGDLGSQLEFPTELSVNEQAFCGWAFSFTQSTTPPDKQEKHLQGIIYLQAFLKDTALLFLSGCFAVLPFCHSWGWADHL